MGAVDRRVGVVRHRVPGDATTGTRAAKRGGGGTPALLDSAVAFYEAQSIEPSALDEELEVLARIVELRAFGELTSHDTAKALGVSERTAGRGSAMAFGWLRERFGVELDDSPG